MTLEPYGFDPDALLVKAPPKKPETTEKRLPDPDVEKRFNLCEFHLCLKKAQGHFGSMNLCWEHGKHLEKNWKNQFGTNWYYQYWRKLDAQLNRSL